MEIYDFEILWNIMRYYEILWDILNDVENESWNKKLIYFLLKQMEIRIGSIYSLI